MISKLAQIGVELILDNLSKQIWFLDSFEISAALLGEPPSYWKNDDKANNLKKKFIFQFANSFDH